MAAAYMTRRGYDLLYAELRDLIDVRRPQVMSDLAQAREYGDISENAEYETAKRDQGMIEGRIHELQGLLNSVEIAEVPKEAYETALGVRVRVENIDFGHQREYTLVTEHEAHLVEDFLSVDSPLGRALIGRKPGETVTFEAPAGTRKFKILELFGANGEDE
ncbi:MAG: transcription elongation factor GreA [Armatimonadota bacterium]